ncbi:MAG: hypothetical protein V1678_02160 [Candidatus Aenigmatarchaeota archaeon]
MQQLEIHSDYEGPMNNCGGDLAWQTYKLLVSESTKAKYPEDMCKRYDGDFDDGKYFYSINKSERWATGTWPSLSLAIAAVDGKTDDDLIELAGKTVQLAPGVEKMLTYLVETFGPEHVHFETSSYPAAPLMTAKEFGIPFYNVAANGIQRYGKKDITEEIKTRSPMGVLSKNKAEVERFLQDYVPVCEKLGSYYVQPLNSQSLSPEQLEDIRSLENQYAELFPKVKDNATREALEGMFLTQEYDMGSHRKVDAMKRFGAKRATTVYGGDGIVDAMPIDWANFGFSINMKDKHALSLSKMNFATADMSLMIPMYESIRNGEFGSSLQTKLGSEKFAVFTPKEIRRSIEVVVKENGKMKDQIKGCYKPRI